MTAIPPRLRRAYLVGNTLAMLIALLAGFINLAVGPRNPLIFVAVPFQFLFATSVLFFADSLSRQPESPPPFWVGKRGFPSLETWNRKMAGHHARTMRGFLIFTPAFFLVVSVALLCAAITRTVNPL
jgi:hypothetical protein